MPVRVLYVLKRYPRLSETFIVNEIRALERLGVCIEIVSLMQPETGQRHEIVTDVAARIEYFPARFASRAWHIVRSHAAAALANPAGYARALLAVLVWTTDSRKPLSLWKHFLRAGYVAAIVRNREHTRIHAHFAHGPSTVTHFASLMTGVPFAFTAHAKDLYLSRPSSVARRVAAAKFVATCTRYNAEYIAGHVEPAHRSKVALIYHGIDLGPFRALARRQVLPDASPAQVLCVGRLVQKKGIADVICACGLLRDRGLEFRCTIAGDGPLRESLQRLSDRLDLRAYVTMTGAMPHERLRTLFQKADAFVLASVIAEDGDRDGIPNVLVEAAAAGVPIVTTAISGIPELIEDGVTGLLVEPRSPTMLADAIYATLTQPEATARRVAAAAVFVSTHFDAWLNAQELAGLFREVA